MAYSGKFPPRNPQKYLGDPTNIIFRSLWERNIMVQLDMDDRVINWGSEEMKIPYKSPVDKKYHMYYPDFLVKIKQPDGTHIIRIIEVKPQKQCEEPKLGKRVTKKFINEVLTYEVNQAKWNAAKIFAQNNGWEFVVLTENEIFKKKP